MSATTQPTRPKRPEQAIESRRRAAAHKLKAVAKAVKTLARSGAPVSRAAVAQLAGVSRSFTYENPQASALITNAQTRSQAKADEQAEEVSAQQQASWRERALNAEDQIRVLRHDLHNERRLLADLLGQLREPDGTWIEQERNRLRSDNQQLLAERNQLTRERDAMQRKLDAARANLAHQHQRSVTKLFPDGPAPSSK